jgi:hypothetical protein
MLLYHSRVLTCNEFRGSTNTRVYVPGMYYESKLHNSSVKKRFVKMYLVAVISINLFASVNKVVNVQTAVVLIQ